MSYFRGSQEKDAKMAGPAVFANHVHPKFSKGTPVDMYLFINQQQQVPQGRFDMRDLVWSEVCMEPAPVCGALLSAHLVQI